MGRIRTAMYPTAPQHPDPPKAEDKESSPGHPRLSQGRVAATGGPVVAPATILPCTPLGSESQLIISFFFPFLSSPLPKTETGPIFPSILSLALWYSFGITPA